MTREEQHPLPESIGGLVALAVQAYGKRIGAYTALTLLSMVVQALVVLAWPANLGAYIGTNLCLDALIVAFVTLGVVADLGLKGQSTRVVLSHAVQRWWVIAAIGAVQLLLQLFLEELTGGAPDIATLLSAVIITLINCALAMSTVVGAIDTTTRSLFIIPVSIGRGLAVSLAWPNISRLMLLAALFVVPMIVAAALDQRFHHLHPTQVTLAIDIPVDALATGPLQALFSVFYLDFVRRLITRARVP